MSELHDADRTFNLTAPEIALINPNTRTCPIFRSRRDAEITKKIYARVPVLVDEAKGDDGNPWGLTIRRVFDMNQTQVLAHCVTERPAPSRANAFSAVLESKMIHQFDHRFGDYADRESASLSSALPSVRDETRNFDYAPVPRYWLPKDDVSERLSHLWSRQWLLVWRDICRSTDFRTTISAIIPYSATDFTLRVGLLAQPQDAALLLASLNSFVFDFCSRQKNGGTHLSDYLMRQLPVPARDLFKERDGRFDSGSLGEWIEARVLELVYTAHDIEPFARDLGYEGPPFHWDAERRFLIRAELDAAFFHLYGLTRDEVDYIMDTFPIVRRADEAAHNEYRTKRVILEIYDAMQTAASTGTPYTTLLSPPPGDPLAAHGDY